MARGNDCRVALDTANWPWGILLVKVLYHSHFEEKQIGTQAIGTQEQPHLAVKPPMLLSKSWAGNSSLFMSKYLRSIYLF